MNIKTTISSPLKRMTVLDSLRGFALLGVILIHMIQHFGISSLPSEEEVMRFPALDQSVQWIGSNIIMGRFINIFAFLFGLSFFIQMDRAAQKGIDFRKRFVWRMIILMVMGLLSHSFFNLEIISIYALFGLLMIPLYKVKNWVLISLIAFFVLGGPRLIQIAHHNHEIKSEITSTGDNSSMQRSEELPEHLKNPSFLTTAKYNYKERLARKLNYQFSFVGRGYVTFALFILGLFVGRLRFFEKIDNQKKLNQALFVGFILATILLSFFISALPTVDYRLWFRPEGEFIPPTNAIVQALRDVNLLLFSGALSMGFVFIYHHTLIGKSLDVLSPYGRTALTNYLMQGVIGCILFAPWAFGPTFSRWGVAALFFLGIIIYILQILLSKYWLKYYLYGPLEWLWRSLTYLKAQPFSKRE